MYFEDEFLTLSSLRHFCYCKHLWGLTQLENYWSDNYHTTNGHLAHQKTDNPFVEDKRKNILIVRSLHTSSKRLGLQGVLDTVEFIKNDNGIPLAKHSGKWIPHVVEYKESKTGQGIEDAVDRFVISLINNHQLKKKHFFLQENSSVLLTDNGRTFFLDKWQQRKHDEIKHPFINEYVPLMLLPYVQAQLMAKTIYGELDEYPPFMI